MLWSVFVGTGTEAASYPFESMDGRENLGPTQKCVAVGRFHPEIVETQKLEFLHKVWLPVDDIKEKEIGKKKKGQFFPHAVVLLKPGDRY